MADVRSAVGRRAASGVKVLALAVAIASLSALTAGCASTRELDYAPVRMDPGPARVLFEWPRSDKATSAP
ncbi:MULTISPECIES: hypothetical protein [Streptomyces]|uniref:Uncharacterized protein n=1 Tax=Streptomyces sudanensis TaxID=436397 RepID=A0ABY4T9D4_9ACTN|nr:MULTISPECIES: hypothetical protein [Streptomyces]URN15564.1 hypothetical protein MW084_05910 [Streptomyces sudanensis]